MEIDCALPPSPGGHDAGKDAGQAREALDRALADLLPAAHGVIALEGAHGTVQVAATGDLRAFARRRLVETDGPRADLSEVVTRVRAARLGSMFEADCAFLEWARELTPASHGAALDRWRAWFLRLDPGDHAPAWRKLHAGEAVGMDPATLIGPIQTKDAAAKYGRGLDDLFELCREPRLLADRPNARACAYKEMGCPAPCDGSEPIEAYRQRVGEALALAAGGVARATGENEQAMREAAGAMDFERAAELRVRGERLEGLGKRAFRWATRLDRFGVVAVGPTGRKGWARVLTHCLGETRWWGDVPVEGARDAANALIRDEGVSRAERCDESAFDLTNVALERIGLVGQAVYAPGSGAVSFLPWTGRHRKDPRYYPGRELDGSAFARAVRRAAKADDGGEDRRVGASG